MAGRMWLGAPALAVLFTYGVAEAATSSKPEALVTSPEQTPAWAALPAIAERLSVGLAQTTPNFVQLHSTHTASWLADTSADRRVLDTLSLPAALPYKVELAEVAMLHRDPGHASPPIAAP
jgi:hypothetical protein